MADGGGCLVGVTCREGWMFCEKEWSLSRASKRTRDLSALLSSEKLKE